jgi:hypothetical protein
MCRQCSPDWKWLDELNPALKRQLTDAEKKAFAEERARKQAEDDARALRKLEEFTAAQLFRYAHLKMQEEQRQWWRDRGVSDDWQDYLQLGYVANKIIKYDEQLYNTPAYTIPYLRQDGNPVTMQYRLAEPPDPKDKYRFEDGLKAAWYQARLQPIGDEVVICEGAIKSIVTAIYGGIKPDVSILAVPAKESWAGIVEAVRPCGRVWVILDPDGQQAAAKLCAKIGPAARQVTIPEKIDDALLSGMQPNDLKDFFRYARK